MGMSGSGPHVEGPGDANSDGKYDNTDASFLINFLYAQGPEPRCRDAADANGDRRIDMGDVTYILQSLHGMPAPDPWDRQPECDINYDYENSLGCEQGCDD
jgi:hypothetical protein